MHGSTVVETSTYLEHGSTLVDRIRTRMVQREIQLRLPRRDALRVLDLGCGFHFIFLKGIGNRLQEGVGVDFRVSEEGGRHPRLRFIQSSIEDALPQLPAAWFDVVLLISVLEHLEGPAECLEHCHRVLKPGGRLLVNVPTWYAKPLLELLAFRLGASPAYEMDDHKMYNAKRDLWPLLVRAGFKPSRIRMEYRKACMILLAAANK